MKEEFTIKTALPLIPCECKNMNTIFINQDVWDNVSKIKEVIDTKDIKDWDKHKKYTNDYELIYLSSKIKENDSIASIKPLSRSYFKMVELIKDCDIDIKNNLKCGFLAEGPGGFVQATIDLLNKREHSYNCHAITLRSVERDIPGWNKGYKYIKKHKIKIHYGVDNTGDLYNINNILHFADAVGHNSCELVTADGGFDFSNNFNKQEEMSYKLLLCEIFTNLLIQKKQGTFVIKFFDIFTKLTLQFIYFLGSYYDTFTIIKPKTSRIANSEKYIVFKGFKGCPTSTMDTLSDILRTTKDYNELSLFTDFESLSFIDDFITKVSAYNSMFSNKQIESIEKTLSILNTDNKEDIKKERTKLQIKYALDWCRDYDIPINFYSRYLKSGY